MENNIDCFNNNSSVSFICFYLSPHKGNVSKPAFNGCNRLWNNHRWCCGNGGRNFCGIGQQSQSGRNGKIQSNVKAWINKRNRYRDGQGYLHFQDYNYYCSVDYFLFPESGRQDVFTSGLDIGFCSFRSIDFRIDPGSCYGEYFVEEKCQGKT